MYSTLEVISHVSFCPVDVQCHDAAITTISLSDPLQVDVFSFGIMLCEILARIPADPEVLPRTRVKGHLSLSHT